MNGFMDLKNYERKQKMDDYALPLLVLRRLSKDYEEAMLLKQEDKAYQIASDLVDMALKLQDLAGDKQKV
jgi:hypothetical protein